MRVGPDGTTRLTSRLGNEITTIYPDLRSVLAETLAGRPAVFDGELVVLGQDGRPDFQLMQSRHQRGPTAELLRTAPVTYIMFDLLRLGEQVLVTTPYTRRRELLADLPVSSPRVAVPRHFTAETSTRTNCSRWSRNSDWRGWSPSGSSRATTRANEAGTGSNDH